MTTARRFFLSMCVGSFFLAPSLAFAQLPPLPPNTAAVDSFFDVLFKRTHSDDPNCDICKLIEDEIAKKEADVALLQADLDTVGRVLDEMSKDIEAAVGEVDAAKAALKEFQNPQNFVESEGRRYDSADHMAMQERSAMLWDAYKEGDMTAQEYSDEVAKDFDDPDVQKELDTIKKDLEEALEQDIELAEKRAKELKDKFAEWSKMEEEMGKELAECLTELDSLRLALKECKNMCAKGPVDLALLGVPQEAQNFIDSFFDIFTGLFEPPPPLIPGLPDIIGGLELPPLGPPIVLPPMPVPQDPIVVLPEPKCQMCDPIRKEIAEKEAFMKQLSLNLAQAEGELDQIGALSDAAADLIEELQESIDNLNNPSDYVESEGRRYDSSDHAAMQVRNQRLWSRYRSGDLSASDLEAEWEKPFDDPDVRKELDDIKNDMVEELEDGIEDIDDLIDDYEEKMDALEDEIATLKDVLAECNTKLAAMQAELEACLKQCKNVQDAVGFIEDLLGEDGQRWSPPGGYVMPPLPLPVPPDAIDACMSHVECETTCLPQGKACIEISKAGKTCFACSDDNECASPAVNLKVCEEQCDGGSCDRDQRAGPACFTCSGCLKPTMNRIECEQTCVPKGGACVQNTTGGESCFDCSMDNPCKAPAMNLKECEAKCGGCERNEKAGAACFDCLDPEDDPVSFVEDLLEETTSTGVIPMVQSEQTSFFCNIPLISKLCDDEEDDTDDMAEDAEDPEEPTENFMCSWFGVFCPEEEPLSLNGFVDCAGGYSRDCEDYDHNADGTVDATDFNDWDLVLQGPNGTDFPLIIDGFDGSPGTSIEDIGALNDCLSNSEGFTCDDLDFNLPPRDELFTNSLVGLNGSDFDLVAQNGSDVLFGDPINPGLINIGGGSDDLLGGDDPLSGDLFGPGGDTFGGPLGGIDLGVTGDSFVDDFPPPPPVNQDNMANDPQVRQVVAAAVATYLRQHPLGECEKLVVEVRRVRIGNKVQYTVTIKRVRDDSLCPPTCNKDGGFDSMEACQSGCDNPDTCGYDGGLCWMCNPEPIFEDGFESGDTSRWDQEDTPSCNKDGGYDSMEECFDFCGDPDTCGYDGGVCYVCGQYKPEPVCGNEKVEDGEDCDDGNTVSGDGCSAACHLEAVSSRKCPEIAHATEKECRDNCTNGKCGYKLLGDSDITEQFGCFFCFPEEFESSSKSSVSSVKEQCDSPTMTQFDCDGICDGNCEFSYETISGLECFECKEFEPVCGDGNVDLGEQCDDGNTTNGDGCDAQCQMEPIDDEPTCPSDSVLSCNDCGSGQTCEPISDSCFSCIDPIDDGPTCPSGSTGDSATCESQCPSDGTCIEEDGCYSCVVVNCPTGTFKDACPENCSNGCDVVGQQHGVSCYQCKQDCATVCADNDFGPEDTDHSSAILGELNGYSCVSGANISIQTATIGSCNCVGDYSLSVDTAVPVCTGTPCGDVACGQSASCAGGPNETITVNCNWGGWEKIQKHQFRPVVGN